MIARVEEELAPIRARRAELARKPDEVRQILASGTARARAAAAEMMALVRERVGVGGGV
jgi:tryptophanyl-tRNA synthetase